MLHVLHPALGRSNYSGIKMLDPGSASLEIYNHSFGGQLSIHTAALQYASCRILFGAPFLNQECTSAVIDKDEE